MSKQLLYCLNGRRRNGPFKAFLDGLDGEPRIAWYPSARLDFRPLLYLNPGINEIYPGNLVDPQPPDIFLFTDYHPLDGGMYADWESTQFHRDPVISIDEHTTIIIESIERLPPLHLPLHPQIVHFPEGSPLTNSVMYMRVRVVYAHLGEFVASVVYAFVENEAFYCNVLAEQNASISHIIHVCYGGSCGGGKASGVWLMNVMQKLNTEVYVSDRIYEWQDGDRFALEFCDEIPPYSNAVLTPYRIIERIGWEYNLVQYGGINEDI